MAYTISAHNGSQVRQAHNLRIKKVIEKEDHIKEDGEHYTLKHRDLKEAYKSIFDEALKEYNERVKKKNPDRVKTMDEYLNGIFAKMNKSKNSIKPCYEIILQIGNLENHPNDEVNQAILEDFYFTFEKTFSKLEVIGAYIHNDEDGAMHMHIDYIPIADCERGMKKQPLINRALEQMGYKSENINDTAQMQFQEDCRIIMRNLCLEYGIEVDESKKEYREHMETDIFKLNSKFEELAHMYNELVKNYNNVVYDLRKSLEKLEAYEEFFKKYDNVMLPILETEAKKELIKIRNKEVDEVQII